MFLCPETITIFCDSTGNLVDSLTRSTCRLLLPPPPAAHQHASKEPPAAACQPLIGLSTYHYLIRAAMNIMPSNCLFARTEKSSTTGTSPIQFCVLHYNRPTSIFVDNLPCNMEEIRSNCVYFPQLCRFSQVFLSFK